MEKSGKKVTIEVLMEGNAGELVFKPVEASTKDLKALKEATNNPVLKYNLEKSAKEKKVRI